MNSRNKPRLIAATLLYCAAVAAAADHSNLVRPVDWARYSEIQGAKNGDAFGQSITAALQGQLEYLPSWLEREYPLRSNAAGLKYRSLPASRMGDDEEKYSGFEAAVRPLAQFAWSKAVMIQTGIYPATGKALQEAIVDTELAIRGVAFTHLTHTPRLAPGGKAWGAHPDATPDWQSTWWASSCAGAAWMLWEHLHPATKKAVVQMLEYEADRHASPTTNIPVDYWKDRNGKLVHEGGYGDSKAESDGWNVRALVTAQAMMPNHPHASLWRTKASELMIGSYSRESDLKNTTNVDGKPVKDWLNGFNTFDDGVMLNHSRVHSAYMTAHGFTYGTLIETSLAGQYVPESAFFNEQVTWDAMTKLVFHIGEDRYGTGENRPPGGTLFQKKADGKPNPSPYFPGGNDWSANSEADVDYVAYSVYAAVRGLDAGQDVKAMDWANAQLEALRRLQQRPGHRGNFFQAGDWAYASEEIEVGTLMDLTEAWIVWWLHQHGNISPVADHWAPLPRKS